MKVFVLAFFLLVLPIQALAQTPSTDPRKDARLHIGPLYVTPTFSLRDFGVDSNVFSDAGQAKSDFTFVLSPGAKLFLPIARRALLTVNPGVDFVYYKTYATERSVDPTIEARAEYYTPRVTFFAEDRFVSSRQRPSFEIDLRSRRQSHSTAGGFEIKFSPRSKVELAAASARQRFDGNAVFLGSHLQVTLDRNTTSYRAVLKSQRTVKTTLFLKMEVAHERFLYSRERDADTVLLLPMVEFAPRALVSGKASAGFRRFKTLSTSVPDFTGVVADLDLGYTLLGATRFGVMWNREVGFSYEGSLSYYIANGVGWSVRRQLFGDVDAIAQWRRYRNVYQKNLTAGEEAPAELIKNLSLDLGYRLRDSARLGFAISRWTRQSALGANRAFEGWRYGVSFVYGQ